MSLDDLRGRLEGRIEAGTYVSLQENRCLLETV